MYGRQYSKDPQILMSSFRDMNKKYKKVAKKTTNNFLQKIYLSLFGIPEIGFQLRSLHFDKALNSKLINKKFSKILDAGSGIGTYSLLLAEKFPKAEIFGGDIDNEKISASIKFAKDLGIKNVEYGYFDVEKSKKNSKYDLIITIDVLEHIEDFKEVLKNLSSHLAPGGFLYIHTPQPDQNRIFKNMKKWHHEDHSREGYTPGELVDQLKNLGLKIVYSNETFGFFGKLAWEINHMTFEKGFLVSGLVFPLLYPIALLDLTYKNRKGLGTSILASKSK